MPGYEDFVQRLQLYIESIVCSFPYEIIVVEDRCARNIALVTDTLDEAYFANHNARLLPYAACYPNPHGYNMIEAFAKNAGIREAKYPFICVTNCDIVFDSSFFEFATDLSPRVFYRFLQYETERIETTLADMLAAPCTCVNPDLQYPYKWTLNAVAYKSGDIMLMDADSWHQIRGFPENEVWVHSDLIVCKVAHNNGFSVRVPKNVRILTAPQTRNLPSIGIELETSYAYFYRVACN